MRSVSDAAIFNKNLESRRDNLDNRQYYVYILTNYTNRVLYTGVTNNLHRRLYEHKNKTVKGFTDKYNCNKLVYFEVTISIVSAIEREKQIKSWIRKKKIDLITSGNPKFTDLSLEWK